jgi:hypothetical protein
MAGFVPGIHVFKTHHHILNPHPEEQTSVCVSKEDPVLSGGSFETVAPRPPQDEA